DFLMQARFTDVPDPGCGRWGRYGPMARLTCDRNSKFTSVDQHGTSQRETPRHPPRAHHPDDITNREYSFLDNGTFGCPGGDPALANQCRLPWVRLIRRGYSFYTYLAEDDAGQPGPWCLVGSDSWTNVKDVLAAQDDTVLAGFHSHNHGSCG